MASEGIKIIFGTATATNPPYDNFEYMGKALDILQAHNVDALDSAQLYAPSEKVLGEAKAGDRFSIDTKWAAGIRPGGANKEDIIKSATTSIQALNVKQVCRKYDH